MEVNVLLYNYQKIKLSYETFYPSYGIWFNNC